ncbi:histidine--tRNA ligase [Dethiobacter alkaliphilus]|uniref:histidine--tRNA ligase n=1 Tax=Dethiobacter alkaliphilus TaxID=427926 RepID=UPI0002FAA48F|nr:histidine--tRNA ligase [Dethiobacter alkaliphilus]
MLTKVPRGTRDILPGDIETWQFFEEKVRELCRLFGYSEIRTPIFEHTELFLRGVGEVTDIVAKEMYTFTDRGDRSLTLRPEGTASVARAYAEHKLYGDAQPIKVYYIGPMFRYDRPQAGRYRQFHQFGVEVFGTSEPTLDAEVMALSLVFFRSLGLTEFTLEINSVGCPQCRRAYRDKLQEELKEKVDGLCPDCADRYDKNPLRILDCKNNKCQDITGDAPLMLGSLCGECDEHFTAVQEAMDALGEQYVVNPRLVRGLDYYTKTAFEIVSPVLGAQSSIGGGGRYDQLLSTIGGPDVPGIGFAIGIERVLLALEAAGTLPEAGGVLDVYVATAGAVPAPVALRLAMDLRGAGLAAEKDYLGRSLKAQMKYADKKQAKFLVILGDEEMQRGQATVRDMKDGSQQDVALADLVGYLAGQVKEAK